MDPLEIFIWIFRGVAIAIVLFWLFALWKARDKPPEWIAPNAGIRLPIQLSRDRYRLAAVLGIAAGLGLLILSAFMPAIL